MRCSWELSQGRGPPLRQESRHTSSSTRCLKFCPLENAKGFYIAEDKSLAVEISPQIFKFDKGATGTEQKLTEVGAVMVIFGCESV